MKSIFEKNKISVAGRLMLAKKNQTSTSKFQKRFALLIIALLVASGLQMRVKAAVGDPDPTFGSAGKVVTNFSAGFDGIADLAIQTDGKVVTVGNSTNGDFSLLRYDSDGNPDPFFGNAGKVTTDFNGGLATGVVLQTDGKIIVVGRANGINATADFGLMRYDAFGNPDPTFGNGGKVTTDFSGDFDAASAVIVQNDGKVIVVGRATSVGGTKADFGIVRYDKFGNPDPNFGNGGKVITDFSGNDDSASAVALQSDGKLVVAGSATLNSRDFAVARYDNLGNPDMSFGSGGKVTTDFLGGIDRGSDVAIQNDGKIVVAGVANDANGVGDFGVVRYDIFGGPDVFFGNGGKVRVDFGNAETANGMALQADGRIVICGTVQNNNLTNWGVACLDTNGNPDASFGNGGKVTTDFFGNDDGCGAIAIQSDGKIIVGGFANTGNETDFALVRYDGGINAPPVPVFDVCLQDNANPAKVLKFATTGADKGKYRFCNNTTVYTGVGTVTQKGQVFTLQYSGPDRRLQATVDKGSFKGNASLQSPAGSLACTISDKNITDNSCVCP
jgi:uncharacterized delta-60 repeat protein